MLNMTETTMGKAEQIRATLEFGDKKLRDIEERIEELNIMRMEMLTLKDKLIKRLQELKHRKENS